MNEEPIIPPAPGMTLGDIYYILFRHKWKIIIFSALGLITALILPAVMSRPFQSEAKIFIRYVLETKSPGQAGGDSRIKSPDEGGGSIINSEIEILTSLDLAQQVADIIGPEKILGHPVTGPKDRFKAAHLVREGLVVPSANKSSVIHLVFQHSDPSVVQPVLNELVENYFKKHAEVHRGVGAFDDFLTRETDQLRSRLVQTENALRAAKTNAGILSVDESKKSFNTEMSRIRSEIFDAEAELAERRATISEITKLTGSKNSQTNATPETNAVDIPTEKVSEYRRVAGLLEILTKREQDLSLIYTSENWQLKNVQEQIALNEKIKKRLEQEEPRLLGVTIPDRSGGGKADPRIDLQAELAAAAALTSKIEALTNQLAQVRQEAASVDAIEGAITELQRKKELEESNYKYYAAKLEESRIDEALSAGRVSNISIVQEPSPPLRDNRKLIKLMLGTCVGGFVAALVWAFLTELYLDRSLRRPSQIDSQLQIPLFLTIPQWSLGKKASREKKKLQLPSITENREESKSLISKSNEKAGGTVPGLVPTDIASWDAQHPLHPFYETLRDRLIAFFEANNLIHKPKLVALTSCGQGAGVTTTAMGLAASLSETGEGNVLLVDMNFQDGEAHHFYKGRLECGLDEALRSDKRESALVQENLYVVTETSNGNKLPALLPKRFKHLIPRLRASDYDYIIFDMPPVNQISATPRLAQFMDMVFLVVESEKTNRDVAKRAAQLLTDAKANVGIVLNKTEAYVPKRLHEDI